MSIRHVGAVLAHFPVGGTDKLVLLALADHADNHSGICWPSISRLGAMACAGRSSVKRALGRLTDDRNGPAVVSVIHTIGRGRANKYRVNIEVLLEMPLLVEPPDDPLTAEFNGLSTGPVDNSVDNLCATGEKGSGLDPKGVHFDTERGPDRTPNLSEPKTVTVICGDNDEIAEPSGAADRHPGAASSQLTESPGRQIATPGVSPVEDTTPGMEVESA